MEGYWKDRPPINSCCNGRFHQTWGTNVSSAAFAKLAKLFEVVSAACRCPESWESYGELWRVRFGICDNMWRAFVLEICRMIESISNASGILVGRYVQPHFCSGFLVKILPLRDDHKNDSSFVCQAHSTHTWLKYSHHGMFGLEATTYLGNTYNQTIRKISR